MRDLKKKRNLLFIKIQDFLISIIIFIACVVIDFHSKEFFKIHQLTNFTQGIDLVRFIKIYNNGMIFNSGTILQPEIIHSLFVTYGILSIFLYIFFILWFYQKSFKLKIGINLIVGGFLSNLIDRLLHHYVFDFIQVFQLPYAFNFADLFQWIGLCFFIMGLIESFQYYWPKIELREGYLIDVKNQMTISLLFSSLVFLLGLIILIIGSIFFIHQENFFHYFIFASLVTVFISVLTFVISIIITHRIFGPIFALSQKLNVYLNNNEQEWTEIKFRKKDYFQDLANLINKIFHSKF